jgi:NRPS condensation-like uncharacterized protein
MTSLQRSMILASLAAPREGLYLVQDVCELDGTFSLPLLRDAWRGLVRRHSALSLAVTLNDGVPTGFHADDQAAERWREEEEDAVNVEDFLRRDRVQGFEFESGAPLRITAIRTSGSLTLVWTVHHALIDGRSMNRVWKEWLEAYDRSLNGLQPDSEPAPPSQSEPPLAPHTESFWRDYLSGLSQSTGYIADPLPIAPTSQPVERQTLALSTELTERLREFANNHGVTLNTLIQGA